MFTKNRNRLLRGDKVRHRGLAKVHWIFKLALAAYSVVRTRTLAVAAA